MSQSIGIQTRVEDAIGGVQPNALGLGFGDADVEEDCLELSQAQLRDLCASMAADELTASLGPDINAQLGQLAHGLSNSGVLYNALDASGSRLILGSIAGEDAFTAPVKADGILKLRAGTVRKNRRIDLVDVEIRKEV